MNESWSQQIKEWVERINIRTRLILLFIFLILIPGSILLYWYYDKMSDMIERDMNVTILQSLKQVEINITNRISYAESLSNSLIANPDMIRYLSSAKEPLVEQYDHFKSLEKLLASFENNNDIKRIRLYIQPELLYANEGIHFFPLSDIETDQPWFNTMNDAHGSIVWSVAKRQAYLGEDETYVLSAARILRNPKQFDSIIGVLVVDVHESLISGILSNLELQALPELAIIDTAGHIVTAPSRNLLGTTVDWDKRLIIQLFQQNQGYHRIGNNGEFTLLYQQIPIAEWMIVAKFQTNEITGDSVTRARISTVVILVVGFILFVFALVLIAAQVADRISRRIRQMIRMMKTGGLDHLNASVPQQDGDLRKLEHNIANMVQTVQDLTAESYQAKLQERDAQFRALQAQINPHFLYNTLDSINWMAIRLKADEISNVIESLSVYFRLSLSKGRDIVTLEEELQLIQAYIHIQNIRNAGGIEVVYDISKHARDCPLPKLILQPIVENAVIHGIYHKRPKVGTIRITAQLQDDWLIILVADDGAGMPEEQTKSLLISTLNDDEPPSSYGLYNVQERIRLFSRDAESGIYITSTPTIGTEVTMRIKNNSS
jgi:two-component system sensor histidine kinase YesM